MNTVWYAYLGCILVTGVLDFAVSFIFADLLHPPRCIFLVPHIALASLFLPSFMRWSGIPFQYVVRHNWVWGLVGAILLAIFLIKNILSQLVSPGAKGFFDLFAARLSHIAMHIAGVFHGQPAVTQLPPHYRS